MTGHALRYFLGQTFARGMIHLYSLGLARVLSNTSFVEFTYFLIVSNVYARIANYSLNMVMVKYRYTQGSQSGDELQDNLYRFAGSFGLIITCLALLLNTLFRLSPFWSIEVWPFNLALLSGYFLSIENNLIEVYQSRLKSSHYLTYMVSFTAVLAVVSGLGYGVFSFQSSFAPMACYVISQGLVLLGARAIKWRWRFPWSDVRGYLLAGTPICLYGLSSYASRYLEMFVLRNNLGVEELASFTFTFRVVEALTLVAAAAAAVVTPYLFGGLKAGSIDANVRRKIQGLLFAQIIFFGVYSLAVAPLVHLYVPQFAASLRVVPLLYLASCLAIFVSLGQSFVIYYDQYNFMLLSSVAGLILGFGLSFLAVPIWGMQGAVLAKSLALIFVLAGYFWSVRKKQVTLQDLGLRPVVLANLVVFFLVAGFYTWLA